MEDIELTDEEEKAIRALKRVAKTWPKSLWLFSASGDLHVMKCDEYGSKIHKGEGIDPDYSVNQIDILNDGGDW